MPRLNPEQSAPGAQQEYKPPKPYNPFRWLKQGFQDAFSTAAPEILQSPQGIAHTGTQQQLVDAAQTTNQDIKVARKLDSKVSSIHARLAAADPITLETAPMMVLQTVMNPGYDDNMAIQQIRTFNQMIPWLANRDHFAGLPGALTQARNYGIATNNQNILALLDHIQSLPRDQQVAALEYFRHFQDAAYNNTPVDWEAVSNFENVLGIKQLNDSGDGRYTMASTQDSPTLLAGLRALLPQLGYNVTIGEVTNLDKLMNAVSPGSWHVKPLDQNSWFGQAAAKFGIAFLPSPGDYAVHEALKGTAEGFQVGMQALSAPFIVGGKAVAFSAGGYRQALELALRNTPGLKKYGASDKQIMEAGVQTAGMVNTSVDTVFGGVDVVTRHAADYTLEHGFGMKPGSDNFKHASDVLNGLIQIWLFKSIHDVAHAWKVTGEMLDTSAAAQLGVDKPIGETNYGGGITGRLGADHPLNSPIVHPFQFSTDLINRLVLSWRGMDLETAASKSPVIRDLYDSVQWVKDNIPKDQQLGYITQAYGSRLPRDLAETLLNTHRTQMEAAFVDYMRRPGEMGTARVAVETRIKSVEAAIRDMNLAQAKAEAEVNRLRAEKAARLANDGKPSPVPDSMTVRARSDLMDQVDRGTVSYEGETPSYLDARKAARYTKQLDLAKANGTAVDLGNGMWKYENTALGREYYFMVDETGKVISVLDWNTSSMEAAAESVGAGSGAGKLLETAMREHGMNGLADRAIISQFIDANTFTGFGAKLTKNVISKIVSETAKEAAVPPEGTLLNMPIRDMHLFVDPQLWDPNTAMSPGGVGHMTAAEFEALKESIKRDGITTPLELFVDPKTGQAVMGEGFHRFQAAQALGLESVPVEVKYQAGVEGADFQGYWEDGQLHDALAAHEAITKQVPLAQMELDALRQQRGDLLEAGRQTPLLDSWPRMSDLRASILAPISHFQHFMHDWFMKPLAKIGLDANKLVDELPNNPVIYDPTSADKPLNWYEHNSDMLKNMLRIYKFTSGEISKIITDLAELSKEGHHAQDFYAWAEDVASQIDRHLPASTPSDVRIAATRWWDSPTEGRTNSVLSETATWSDGTTSSQARPILSEKDVMGVEHPLPSRPTEFVGHITLPSVDTAIEAMSTLRRMFGSTKVSKAAFRTMRFILAANTALWKAPILALRIPAMAMRIQMEQALRARMYGNFDAITLFPGGVPMSVDQVRVAVDLARRPDSPLSPSWSDPRYSSFRDAKEMNLGNLYTQLAGDRESTVRMVESTSDLMLGKRQIKGYHYEGWADMLKQARADMVDRVLAQHGLNVDKVTEMIMNGELDPAWRDAQLPLLHRAWGQQLANPEVRSIERELAILDHPDRQAARETLTEPGVDASGHPISIKDQGPMAMDAAIKAIQEFNHVVELKNRYKELTGQDYTYHQMDFPFNAAEGHGTFWSDAHIQEFLGRMQDNLDTLLPGGARVPQSGGTVVMEVDAGLARDLLQPENAGDSAAGLRTFIAIRDGQVIGIAEFRPRDVTVMVDPEFRRQGVATMMYDHAKAEGVPVDTTTGAGMTSDAGAAFSNAYRDNARGPSPAENTAVMRRLIERRAEHLRQITRGDPALLEALAHGRVFRPKGIVDPTGDPMGTMGVTGLPVVEEYKNAQAAYDGAGENLAVLRERYANGKLTPDEIATMKVLEETRRTAHQRMLDLEKEYPSVKSYKGVRVDNVDGMAGYLRQRFEDTKDITMPDHVVVKRKYTPEERHGILGTMRKMRDDWNTFWYAPYRVLTWADIKGTRGSMYYQSALRYYNSMIALGYDEAFARGFSQMKAAELVSDVMYDLSARTSAQRATRDVFWFAPATQEVLYTWLWKVPSEAYPVIGHLAMVGEIRAMIKTFQAFGLIQKDEQGNDVIPVPGLANLLAGLTGSKFPNTEYMKLTGFNLVLSAPFPALSTLPAALLGKADRKWGGPFKAIGDVVLPYGPEVTAWPSQIIYAYEALTGKAFPAEFLSPEYAKWRYDRAMGAALQYSASDLIKNGIEPPRPEQFADGTSDVTGKPTLSPAAEDKFRAAQDAYMSQLMGGAQSYFRGAALISLLGSSVSPASIYSTSKERQDWLKFWNNHIVPLDDGKNDGLSQNQKDLINKYLGQHPGSLPFYTYYSTVTGKKIPTGEPIDSQDYYSNYAEGLRKVLSPEEYSRRLQLIQSYRFYTSQLDSALRDISPDLKASELLSNGYLRTQALVNYHEQWDRYLALNPQLEADLKKSRQDFATAYGIPQNSYEAERLSQTIDLLSQASALFTGEGGARIPDYRKVLGQLKGLYAETGTFGAPRTQTEKDMNWYFDHVLTPYMNETGPLYEQARTLAEQGASSASIYDQVRAINEKYAAMDLGHNGQTFPTPEQFFYGSKNPHEQEYAKFNWTTKPMTWLTPFQMDTVGYPKFDGRDQLANELAKWDAGYQESLIKGNVAPGSKYADQLDAWATQQRLQLGAKYGQDGIAFVQMNYAAPYVRLNAANFNQQSDVNWSQVTTWVTDINQRLAADGVSPKGYGAEAVYYKKWLYAQINSFRQTDPTFNSMMEQLAYSIPDKDQLRREGTALYEAVFFGQFDTSHIPSELQVGVNP